VTDATLALPQAELQVQALAKVRLEGCVVDGQWMGAPGTAVHVRMADGRAVGTAITNAQGVFVMAVPAQSAIVLDTDVQATGGLVLNTGNAALSVAGCLVAGL